MQKADQDVFFIVFCAFCKAIDIGVGGAIKHISKGGISIWSYLGGITRIDRWIE